MPAIECPIEDLYALCKCAKEALGMDMLVDLAAIDFGQEAKERFGVAYHLFSSRSKKYLRVVTMAQSNQKPQLPSVVDIWPAANWHEREAYDLMGITFEGHPDLRRILLWEGYHFHPLRKEFPLAGIETELPSQDIAESRGTKVVAAPMQGGPFRAQSAATMKNREPAALDESWAEKNPKRREPELN